MQAPRWRCKIPTLCIGKVQAIKVLSLNQWPNVCLIFNGLEFFSYYSKITIYLTRNE